MLFGRNRNVKVETVVLPEELQDPKDREAPAAAQAGPDDGSLASEASGPFDISERSPSQGYMDVGSLRLPMVEGLQVRLDVEEATQRLIAVTLTLGASTMQIQAFAAPRSAGLWDEIRGEIVASVGKNQGAEAGERQGPFGTEVLARIPARMPDGQPGWRVARFIGVDGPRWFLRAVVGGEAAYQEQAAEPLNRIFAHVVVDRGNTPLPPRDLLPLHPPSGMRPVDPKTGRPAAPQGDAQGTTRPPERGPEITEVG